MTLEASSSYYSFVARSLGPISNSFVVGWLCNAWNHGG